MFPYGASSNCEGVFSFGEDVLELSSLALLPWPLSTIHFPNIDFSYGFKYHRIGSVVSYVHIEHGRGSGDDYVQV